VQNPGREEVADMTTITPDKLSELAEQEREAWSEYRESLRDLEGRDYEAAETTSWQALQDSLAEVEAERAALSAEPDPASA
jgi:hypothetical protein